VRFWVRIVYTLLGIGAAMVGIYSLAGILRANVLGLLVAAIAPMICLLSCGLSWHVAHPKTKDSEVSRPLWMEEDLKV
jgi:hypothetical protein